MQLSRLARLHAMGRVGVYTPTTTLTFGAGYGGAPVSYPGQFTAPTAAPAARPVARPPSPAPGPIQQPILGPGYQNRPIAQAQSSPGTPTPSVPAGFPALIYPTGTPMDASSGQAALFNEGLPGAKASHSAGLIAFVTAVAAALGHGL